jgi:hypothetical protein
VPTRRSVQQDYIVCLECGFRAQMLRLHLRVAHGLDVAAYRIRWEPTSGLSSHRTGVFDTALDDGQGDAFWAPSRH